MDTSALHVDFRLEVDVTGSLLGPLVQKDAGGATLSVTVIRHGEPGSDDTSSAAGKASIGPDGVIEFSFPLLFSIDEDATPENGFPGMENDEALGDFVEWKVLEALSDIAVRAEIEMGGETVFIRESVAGTLPRRENGVMAFNLGEVELDSVSLPSSHGWEIAACDKGVAALVTPALRVE